jgi:sugar lactone lactonase YvrE
VTAVQRFTHPLSHERQAFMPTLKTRLVAVLFLACTHATSWAQSLPPIYDKTPVNLAPTTVIAEFAKGTFLENITADAAGNLFINSHLDGKIYRIDKQGRRSEWATIDGTIAGIALNPDGSALISGWIKGKEPAVFTVDVQGRSELLMRLPDAQFPNGVVRLAAGRYLVADSYRGAIWDVDSVEKSAKVWLEHESLTRADPNNPTPGVNGLKVSGGALYASNTARQLLVRIPIVNGAAGTAQTLMQGIGLDDFAFDDSGVLYGATHVYNSLVRVTPQGAVTVMAGLAQGMAGSTAVAASKPPGTAAALFVVTNGGLSLPPEGGVQTAKVLRIDIAAKR